MKHGGFAKWAAGAVWLLWSVALPAQDVVCRVPGDPRGYYGYDDRGLVSLRGNATVAIGGEIRVDYAYRSMKTRGADPGISLKYGDLSVKNANLRILADLHPNVRAFFKLDFSADDDPSRDRDEILEEAMVVMRAVGGLELFAGRGRAPYGQDVTIGMLQSYHHAANRADSSEGRVFIIDPPDDVNPADPGGRPVAPMRPGQFDRAFMAGASYQWDERWKVELAAFQPHNHAYRARLADRDSWNGGADIGAAGRVWWRPFEELTVQASGMLARSNDMARLEKRLDVPDASDASGRKFAYAASVGFDWRRGPWRAFGEYQHGWDWNFTDGYHTDAWQIGLARNFAKSWRVGTMVEGLRISDRGGKGTVDDFYKLTFTIRYVFSSGLFVLAEYGHEWFRRDGRDGVAERRRGDYFGMRLGFSF